jgi:hypothetical protein
VKPRRWGRWGFCGDFEVFAIKDIDARWAKIDGGDPSWPRAIARAGEIDRITLKAQFFFDRLSLGCVQNRNQVDDNLTGGARQSSHPSEQVEILTRDKDLGQCLQREGVQQAPDVDEFST